jgi:hypothetical protein
MSRRTNLTISIFSLVIILFGVRFAVAQEARRRPDYLQGIYRKLNLQFFRGELPKAQIEWDDLSDEEYMGLTYQRTDDSFVILIDRETNSGDDELLDTVKHETCHVATHGQEDNSHGPLFQRCMTALKAWKP